MRPKKNTRSFPKVAIHIIAISLFMFGFVIIHAVKNFKSSYDTMIFFGVEISQNIVFDLGLLCISMAFFIEFLFTFKPIYVLTQKKKK